MSWNNEHSRQQPPPYQPGGMPGAFAPPPPPTGRPGWARKRVIIPSAVGLFFFGVVVGSSGNSDPQNAGSSTAEPAPTVTKTVTARPVQPTADAADAKPTKKPEPKADDRPTAVPDFIGMGLQSAQDAAQAKGFYILTSHDSSGRERLQALDRNWKVCSQNHKAGKVLPLNTELDFGTVKVEENCPAKDAKAPEAAGDTMPKLTGKSVNAARDTLDPGTSIRVTDASPDDRMVLLESNWKVCTQSPAPGTALKGQPVTFTAVKYEESCP